MSQAEWTRSQAAQLDSESVPYFVIPSGFRRNPWDATPGDAGLVLNRSTGEYVPFIVGDTGGNLDEASAQLIASVRNLDALPTVKKTNAFGQEVRRLQAVAQGDFTVAIFRHTAQLIPHTGTGTRPLVLTLGTSGLAEWIETTTASKLAQVGGLSNILECSP